MDGVITEAARALRAGDPLGALKRVALREDAEALALRGVAMAQLGDFSKASQLLRRASRAYGSREVLARARCALAEAEVALAARELKGPDRALAAALRTFTELGDADNARYARLLQARRALLLGRIDEAARTLDALESHGASAMAVAVAGLLEFEVALRQGSVSSARRALDRGRAAATRARIPALRAEFEHAERVLVMPAARLLEKGSARPLGLQDVEAVLASGQFVVDGCRRLVRQGQDTVVLASRPVLFELLRALAEAWPGGAGRDVLIANAFGVKTANATHRARLRVELGRLRTLLRSLAEVRATPEGFSLSLKGAQEVRLLAPPVEGPDAAVLALLADGEHWSTSALALALGASQRTVQRSLATLEDSGRVHRLGRGRALRWGAPPVTDFTPLLLLPALP
ncbi:helix-turn-helix domain-containing protein [Corallococcus sp. M34]|uniref:helix-turn-helix domain-containing protein n=1 Tax=Citreicoccus inhibens TaxID=2849499 RepID=UPI001C246544|nr:helix-turn-helix domain-containing protein [Citreicoccus inhibens]MBU8894098.1 helix-turn-helix domain-containing protein [Citreicoccus inhibens]